MRLLEPIPVDLGLEQERGGALLADLDVAFGGDPERQLPSAASAPRPDGGRYRLVSEAPLHEGCRNRVLRSGGVYRLACRELESVGRFLARDRERPAHPPLLVPDEKEAVDLRIPSTRSRGRPVFSAMCSGGRARPSRGSSATAKSRTRWWASVMNERRGERECGASSRWRLRTLNEWVRIRSPRPTRISLVAGVCICMYHRTATALRLGRAFRRIESGGG